jgi:hypothetical protein
MSWRNWAFRNPISTIVDVIIQLTNSVPMDGRSDPVRLEDGVKGSH